MTAHRTLPGSIQPATTTALPCQRRPDIFGQPLLENPPAGTPELPFQTRRSQALAHAARQLCSSCPLWAECLQTFVVRSDPGGYAAATTEQERRWIRRRLGIGDSQGRLTSAVVAAVAAGDMIEANAVLDAFSALQEHRTRRPSHPARGSLVAARQDPAQRFPAHRRQRVNTDEVSTMAAPAPAGERITYSLGDPALAIQKTVLGPLAHATLLILRVTEQLAGMLAHTPSAAPTPELLVAVGQTRLSLESWRTAAGDDDTAYPAAAADSSLTGSVSIELATSDPVAALRQDIFEPLLRRLADSLRRVEAITAVLVTAPDSTSPGGVPHGPELASVLSSVRELGSRLEQYEVLAPRFQDPAGSHHDVPQGATASASGLASWTTPSLRRAVETAVASFPGHFTGQDVVRALPPGAYQDSAKSVSNALSAMVKSGRLRRVSRGTYTANPPSAGEAAPNT
ncbi:MULTISPECIES: WhiB family transcriptional regulator [unclassified Streptomyces]|uniref:WhiB family transcriptional regulator n=1 Tax=unclassified Streptomyces TaxID=2593676 RepID=UPI002253B6B4|nr:MULTISPECIES: WhiB family transcriptional regulator [unclassified Streptomyces]MCX4542422.1 WhiB family transcriptional regulator [Streptomyces sp. NBC_01565]